MKTADDAVAFFRARGFYASRMPWLGEGWFTVGVVREWRELPLLVSPPPDDLAFGPRPVIHFSHVFGPGEAWSLREVDNRTERHFASLADAVNAVLARLQAWVAEHRN
jgi:hypothetical protein